MTREPKIRDATPTDVDTVRVLLGTIGDTTWRMFVPSVGLTLVGVWLDTTYGTKPWLMAAGIVLGFMGAFLLVRRQIYGIKQRNEARK